MGEKNKRCTHCERKRVTSQFGINPKLVGGLSPWCNKCLELLRTTTGAKGADLNLAYKHDYSLAYAALRRQFARLREKFLFTDSATGDRFGLTHMVKDDIVRVCGPWRLNAMGEYLLTDTFNADPDTISVTGRGGGRGNRKQKRFRIEAYVEIEAWDEGMISAREEWLIEEVTKLGKLS